MDRHRLDRPAAPRRATPWLVGALLLTAVVSLVLRSAAKPDLPGEALAGPPPEIVGRWTTMDAGYADRALTITSQEVEFEVGDEGPPRRGPILSVRRWDEGTTPVVWVEYETVEGLDDFEMLLDASGSMRLRNPPNVVWTRQP